MKRALAFLLAAWLAGPAFAAAPNIPPSAPGLLPYNNLSDLQSRFVATGNLQDVNNHAPTPNDDSTRGNAVNDLWCASGQCWQALSVAQGAALWVQITTAGGVNIGSTLPLDAAGVAAQFAGGTMLMTRNPATIALNKSIDIWRSSDQTTKTIGWAGNYVDAQTADAFCAAAWGAGGWCDVSKIYDQSFNLSTGALNSNDATQYPGWNVLTATVATGGSGCTTGSQTFTVVGGTGGAATITGNVAAGALSGTLTATTPGSYATQPANGASTTGGGCSVQPTLNFTWTHYSGLWTTNLVNGLRTVNLTRDFTAGSQANYNAVSEWYNIPTGTAFDPSTTTVLAAMQTRSPYYSANCLFAINPVADASALCPAYQAFPAGFSLSGTQNAAIVAQTGPIILSALYTHTSTTVTQNNFSGAITSTQFSSTFNGAYIGGGVVARPGDFDFTGFAAFGSNLSAANLVASRAAMALESNTTMQTRRNLIAVIGDSIAYSLASGQGNSWPKFMQSYNLLPNDINVINLGYPGGQFVSGTFDFTANFTATWAAVYSSSIPNIIVPIMLGRNDIATGATAATTYARAQAYATLVAALGPNIKMVASTLLPQSGSCTSTCQTAIAAYNALVVANWNKPIASGGLGASALCDLYDDPLWTSANATTNYLVGGTHPTDPGSLDMAMTCAVAIKPLLQ